MSTYKLHTGDNLEFMKQLIKDGEAADLIYIDPPFNSKRDYYMTSGEKAFTDTWDKVPYEKELKELESLNKKVHSFLKHLEDVGVKKSMISYLTAMGIRLYYMRLLLKDTGSIYYHCDPTASHYIKIVMDYVFGSENFRNEIVWVRTKGHKTSTAQFPKNTDTIFFYSKTKDYNFDLPHTITDEYAKRFKHKDSKGRFYPDNISNPGGGGAVFDFKGYPVPTRGYGCTLETMEKWDEEGLIYYPDSKTKQLKRKTYLKDMKGVQVKNYWDDITAGKPKYPTQKPEALLERIIKASSNPGDLVMDFYNGGGTTGAVCKRLDRNYLGCDINDDAITLTQKRLEDLGCKLNKDLFVNN